MTIGFWQGLNPEQLERVARYQRREEALEGALSSLLDALAPQPFFPDTPAGLARDRAYKVLRETQGALQEPKKVETELPTFSLQGASFTVQVEPDGTAVYSETEAEQAHSCSSRLGCGLSSPEYQPTSPYLWFESALSLTFPCPYSWQFIEVYF